jgi:hypothetical protein
MTVKDEIGYIEINKSAGKESRSGGGDGKKKGMRSGERYEEYKKDSRVLNFSIVYTRTRSNGIKPRARYPAGSQNVSEFMGAHKTNKNGFIAFLFIAHFVVRSARRSTMFRSGFSLQTCTLTDVYDINYHHDAR